jgi:hypothetical protein
MKNDVEAYYFWNKLSYDDRVKLLSEWNFWVGFSQYLWEYLPEDLKEKLRLKID